MCLCRTSAVTSVVVVRWCCCASCVCRRCVCYFIRFNTRRSSTRRVFRLPTALPVNNTSYTRSLTDHHCHLVVIYAFCHQWSQHWSQRQARLELGWVWYIVSQSVVGGSVSWAVNCTAHRLCYQIFASSLWVHSLCLDYFVCVRLFTRIISACMLYYCNTVRWAWLDWGLSGWLTTLLQCFDTVGWVIRPVKTVGGITYIVLAQT